VSKYEDENEDEEKEDEQIPKNKKSNYIRSGLWTKSRNPNLFFEINTWIGFAIMGVTDNGRNFKCFKLIFSFIYGIFRPLLCLDFVFDCYFNS
jgi:steroid 5-alpha reductase family enzyme